MALTKAKTSITQLTASGTSTAPDVSGSYDQGLYLSHSNGTGSVTVAATAKVQVQPSGASRWYDLTTVTFSTTAAATDSVVVALPDNATGVRVVYTQPTGPTGYTLDADAGTITAL